MKLLKRICLTFLLLTLCYTSASSQFSLGIKASYQSALGFDEKWTLSDGQMNFIADPSQGFNVGSFPSLIPLMRQPIYVQPV